MIAFLVAGYRDAFRGLGAAVKLFWPVVLVYLVEVAVGAGMGIFAMADSLAGTFVLVFFVLAMTIYAFLALCQGAAGWHRRILLNEAAGWASPVPRLRSLKYALAVIVFGVIFLVGHLAVTYYSLPYLHSIFTSPLGDIDLTHAPADQLEIWRKAVWPIQVATFATAVTLVAIILWLGRFWLLVYPHISIRPMHPTFEQIRRNISNPPGLVGALLVTSFLPFFLGVVYYALTPISVQLMPLIRIPYTILSLGLFIFCFLWGLSVLSIAYRQAESRDQ